MKKIIMGLLVVILMATAGVIVESNKTIEEVFPKTEDVFGIKIYATAAVDDKKIEHAKAILYEYLDNDRDGQPDNPEVLEAMIEAEAGMMLTKDSKESMKILLLNQGVSDTTSKLQELYDAEIHINGVANNQFDASLEEVLHLITHVGYAAVYPDVFGEVLGSEVANAMDLARGGQFIKIPKKYPETAWYSYYDKTADYGTMVTEYIYWAHTSILNAQSFEGRFEAISGEWKLNTLEKVKEKDMAIYAILTDPQYKMPMILPTGDYSVVQ